MGGSFWGLLAPLLGGLLGVAAAVTPEPPTHLLAEVLTCQPDTPSLDLSLTLDGQRLYSFDFPGSQWFPALPDCPPLPPDLETPPELRLDVELCRGVLDGLGRSAAGVLPQARGMPVAQVFPALPLTLGEANTLLCLVENVFPPALDITWTRGGVPVTRGVTQGPFTPTPELTFWSLSRLEVTLERGDVFACLVTPRGDNASVVTYWVPPEPLEVPELPMVLCGAAMALGGVLGLLGLSLLLLSRTDPQG
ncbi:LOW QUALITY PROTEIN: HLA class II histocompatibility antigen, DM alpha chain-like [Corapipo altera]|uniref:LOW QUALITY PROTEIN: HLA class II histocompatibility antigen, DM alpha chain-like n=1 Tax=Corapipo altera TaxID=415028 RepID=UPI000FD690EE|nr:LOW QUALITY PROTEIN: HLA class II histocompatibility antigen, DM alpha chain-like [Corapipo altera]